MTSREHGTVPNRPEPQVAATSRPPGEVNDARVHLRRYTRAIYTVDAVVSRMPNDAWDHQSPCDAWTAREVLGHLIQGMQHLTSAAHGAQAPSPRSEAESATDQPVSTWAANREALLEALDRPGALDRHITSPFGRQPIDDFLPIHTIDSLLHAWDIARAGGIDAYLPADLASAGVALITSAGEVARHPGILGPAIDIPPSTDPVGRLVAMSGRTPTARTVALDHAD